MAGRNDLLLPPASANGPIGLDDQLTLNNAVARTGRCIKTASAFSPPPLVWLANQLPKPSSRQ